MKKYFIKQEVMCGEIYQMIYVKWFGLFNSFYERWNTYNKAKIRLNELNKIEMSNQKKYQLKQIKIFKLADYKESSDLEAAVNNYVIESFRTQGNYPNIQTNSKFIAVVNDCLIVTNYL